MNQTAPVPGSTASSQPSAAPHAPAADEVLAAIIAALPELTHHHAPGSATYQALAAAARQAVVTLFAQGGRDVPFGPFGRISFPYHAMGAVDSLDLFGLDELILFAFYWQNRGTYQKTADIGGNIGLHSLVMARCGFAVETYEPDPEHVALLQANLRANGVTTVHVNEAAVSAQAGEAEFLRLRGNTTGSHIAGAKLDPYGEIDRFKVRLEAFARIAAAVDFAKIDAEGHEAVIITSLPAARWDSLDVMLEIGSDANAAAIFDYATQAGVRLFTQKTGWRKAESLADLPTSYKQGSAFLTRKDAMPGLSLA
ncbi:FkbM family methyltransferase [Rhodopseudomonas telluris]|uniref:FkbM family methyltransferase n=1 Tax=Rhodopseudomonas telluris TaxID=644215 RepID=A0ABV6EU55_9BRAD